MYARFTDRARKVMQLANREAERFGYEYIGAEHILLGLLKEGSGVAANVLKNLGLELSKLRRELKRLQGSHPDLGTASSSSIPQTPAAKRAIENAIEEASALCHNYVGTEHLLLGLLHQTSEVVVQVLSNFNLTPEHIRQDVLSLLGRGLSDEELASVSQASKKAGAVRPAVQTPAVDRVLDFATEVAFILKDEAVRTEHILIALIEEKSGIPGRVLKYFGIDLEKTRTKLLESSLRLGLNPVARDELVLSPLAAKVVDCAREEVDKLQDRYMRTEHLLLGLLLVTDGVAAQVLVKAGITLDKARKEIRNARQQDAVVIAAVKLPGLPLRSHPPIKAFSQLTGRPYWRFTDRALKVIVLAEGEAKKTNSSCLRTEHILLGLINEGNGVAAAVLKELEVDLHEVRVVIQRMTTLELPRSAETMGTSRTNISHSPHAKNVIAYSEEAAEVLNHSYIGTEHLLLGLIREQEGVAARVLMNFGLKLEEIRQAVLDVLGNI